MVGMVEQAGTGATAAGPMLKRIWDGIFGVGQKRCCPASTRCAGCRTSTRRCR